MKKRKGDVSGADHGGSVISLFWGVEIKITIKSQILVFYLLLGQ
jgi:hypothetical protein